ncbi:uncharacterized protein LOC134659892 [Cydia amplana]|uniref:uncharacterized protein LOC134659892 n=1 Tax=Cydia amplana TaxID=1869771 RepID=UPI002FE5FDE6
MSVSLESADCVQVKAEPSWDFTKPELAGRLDNVVKKETSVDDETTWGLYDNQKVKEELKNEQVGVIDQELKSEELLLGPEVFQQPKVTLVCRGSRFKPSQRCSVRLEQMHLDMDHQTCTIGQNMYKFQQYFPSYDNGTDEENKSSINKRERQTQHVTDTEQPGIKSSRNKLQKTLVGEKLYKCELLIIIKARKTD